ncbi:MAG: 7-cyano-7-deazaguanine synthase [Elusimicrobia bacterium]|nr:7-cyano-7-deazaguanine synthase [Elusimicrobiota bacterium]
MVRKKVCVLASGGADSSALLADLLGQGFEVHPLYARAGFLWEKAEQHWLKRMLRALRSPRLRPLSVVDIPMGDLPRSHWSRSGRGVPAPGSSWDSVYLPGRNLLLLSEAAVFCRRRGIGVVALAVLRGNPFRDAEARFLKSMAGAANAALGANLRIVAPYRRLSKAAALARAPGLPLELTFSCLKPRGLEHCGACSKCEERDALIARGPRS